MTPDELKELTDKVIAGVSAKLAESQGGAKKGNDDEDDDPKSSKKIEDMVKQLLEKKDGKDTVIKQIDDDSAKEKEKFSQQKSQELSVKFNMSFDNLIAEHADMFGGKDVAESTKKVLDDAVRNESLETEKASIRARNLLTVFATKYSEKDNLPDQIKSKLAEWESLTDTDKRAKALRFFDDIVGVTISFNKQRAKAKDINIANALGNRPTSKTAETIKSMVKELEYK
jgi:hypothetical protein